MKKSFLLVAALVLSCTVAFAQQPTKKKPANDKNKVEQTDPKATPNCGNCPNHNNKNCNNGNVSRDDNRVNRNTDATVTPNDNKKPKATNDKKKGGKK